MQQLGLERKWTILAYTLYNLVASLGALPAGVASDRFGRRNVLTIGFLVYAVSYAGFGAANAAWLVWPLFALYGLFPALTEGAGEGVGCGHRWNRRTGDSHRDLCDGNRHHRDSRKLHRRCVVGQSRFPSDFLFRRQSRACRSCPLFRPFAIKQTPQVELIFFIHLPDLLTSQKQESPKNRARELSAGSAC